MMENKHPVIALIPARGGSKGVLRKNLRVVGDKPLVAYTIESALNSCRIDHVYVSYEDDEILLYASSMEALLIRRPDELASDIASAGDVVRHFFENIPELIVEQNPYIIYLQPTSPMRTAEHIDSAFDKMEMQNEHTLVSVVEMNKSPFKSFSIDDSGRLKSLFDEKLSNARRQDLLKAFIPNGAIYIFRMSDFLDRIGFPSNGSLSYIMSEKDSIDIDTEDDIRYLEYILREKNG